MPRFTNFAKVYGAPVKCRLVAATEIRAYEKMLPESLIAEWKDHGFCAYGNGLIWLTEPDQFKSATKEWLGNSSGAITFARSAFGHLFVWNKECAYMLDPQYGTLAKLVNNIDVVFNYVLCRKEYLEDVLDRKLFQKAVKKLGAIEYDECYGFEPAIALGGSGEFDTLRIMKVREHLSILAQLVDEVRNV